MSDQVVTPSIADRSRVVKSAFLQLVSEVKAQEASKSSTIQSGDIQDLLDRFHLWVGSLKVLQPSSRKRSLDHRLQDAEDIRDQICDYLNDLQDAVQDLTKIAAGDSPNRDMHEESADDEAGKEDAPKDEVHMVLEVISECLRSLFRIAVLVRQPSSQDHFTLGLQHSGPAFLDAFNVTFVENMYVKLTKDNSRWLAKRLGSAIAKRRYFINYSRDRKSRLGGDHAQLSNEVGNRRESQSSKVAESVKADHDNLEPLQDQDDESDHVTSVVTASTAFNSATLPNLPRLARLASLADLSPDGQEFECPICFTLQRFFNEKAWRLHAYRDLKPYVCTFKDDSCKNKLFEDRNSWFEHELQYHRSHYTCSLCKEGPFTSTSTIVSHIEWYHGTFAPDQMSMLVDLGRQVPALIDSWDCPFCDDWVETPQLHGSRKGKQVSEPGASVLVSSTQFQNHVATHQEQLTIFALPSTTGRMASRSFGAAASHTTSTVSTRMSGANEHTGLPLREGHHTQNLETVDSLSEHPTSHGEKGHEARHSVDITRRQCAFPGCPESGENGRPAISWYCTSHQPMDASLTHNRSQGRFQKQWRADEEDSEADIVKKQVENDEAGGSSFACDQCDQVFTRVHNLKSHMLCHRPRHPCTLAGCTKKFSRKADLDRHMKLCSSRTRF